LREEGATQNAFVAKEERDLKIKEIGIDHLKKRVKYSMK
jgi:hypothetical protein